jgi:S1-C subfamily serine protease
MPRHGDARAEPASGDDALASAPSRWRRRVPPVVVVALVAVLAFAVGARQRDERDPADAAAELDVTVRTAVAEALEEAAGRPPEASVAYQTVAPSLVVIRAERSRTTGDGTRTFDGLGTGVVVSDQGAILTAHHVIDGASRIELTFADGSTSEAQIVSEEPENDIAVLAAVQQPELIVPAVMGRGPQVGEPVFAVGHPLGLAWSLSAGVVSGLDRSLATAVGLELSDLIQFDAAVNPGNSGGPLVNRAGQVVGIVTSLANPNGEGSFTGIGFAVPISSAAGGAGGPSQ